MRVPDEMVKLFHRIIGFRQGNMMIVKNQGKVTQVVLDGRELAPSEWQRHLQTEADLNPHDKLVR